MDHGGNPLAPGPAVPVAPFRPLDAAWFLAAVAGHPFYVPVCVLALASMTPFWIDQGFNTGRPQPLAFCALLACVFLLRLGLWRALLGRLGRPVPQRPALFFARAHKPALFTLPLTLFWGFLPQEGNAVGLLLLPLCVLASLAVGPLVLRRSLRTRA